MASQMSEDQMRAMARAMTQATASEKSGGDGSEPAVPLS
jgi:hypothetical protein